MSCITPLMSYCSITMKRIRTVKEKSRHALTELGKYEQTEQNPSKYDTASWMSPFAFSEAFRLYL